MRWKATETQYPKPFSHRIRKDEFLLFPLTLDGETRWLETASYEETYILKGDNLAIGDWCPVRWIKDPTNCVNYND